MSLTPIEDSYPLSPMQEGALFHTPYALRASVDIEQLVSVFAEPLDAARFHEAWSRVVAATPALRTAFRFQDVDEPVQEVHREVDVPWVEEDLRGLEAEAQEARIQAYLAEDRARGFDPASAPLLRLALFRTGEAEHQHVFTFHPMILDDGSFPLVVGDVFTAYDALVAGEEPALPERRPFADFVRWQRARDPRASETYWRGVLRGFTPPTPLPGAAGEARSGEVIEHGERAFRLPAAETAALADIGGSRRITLSTLLQGAWSILLSRYSGEGSVVFGVTRACRRSALGGEGTDEMIGALMNTLPVRVDVRPDARALAWLHGLQASGRALRDHEHTPLERVRGFCDLAPGAPIFESLFVFGEASLEATLRARGGAWKRRRFELIRQTDFPLVLLVYGGEELDFAIEYDRRRFDEAAIGRLVGNLRTLLHAFVEDLERPVGELGMMSDDERREILAASVGASVDHVPAEQGPIVGPVPLTPIARAWLSGAPRGASHFNQAFVIEPTERLSDAPLVDALAAIVEHHDALRVRLVDGVQSFAAPGGEPPFSHLRLGYLPDATRTQALEQAVASMQASLDLAEGPALRAALVEMGGTQRLVLVVHHLAVDGVSWRILFEDLWTAYAQRRRGEPVVLRPKTTSMRRWVERLTELAASEAVLAEGPYWTSRAGARLPVDHDLGENTEASSRRILVELEAGETEALLRALPEARGARIDDVLLAALTEAISGWTGSPDVLLDLEGRGREDVGGDVDVTRTLGWLTSVFPVALRNESGLAPGERLRSIGEQLRAVPRRGIGHGLLRYLGPEDVARRLAEAPRAELLFSYLGPIDEVLPEGAPFRLASEDVGPLRSPDAIRPHLVEVGARIAEGRLSVRFTYSEHRHTAATIEALAEAFAGALRTLVRAPDAAVAVPRVEAEIDTAAADSEAPHGEDDEHEALVHGASPLAWFPVAVAIHRRFEARVDRAPSAVAITCEGQSLTYGELDERANRLAHLLVARGVGPGQLVGLCLERSLDMLVALVAVLKAGAAYLPLDPEDPRDRLAFMMSDANAPVLVTQDNLADVIPAGGAAVIRLDADEAEIAAQPAHRPEIAVGPEDLAYVIHTSGSTGTPNGVMVTHANVVRLFDATEATFRFDASDVRTLFHSYASDLSVWEIWGALFYGGRLIVVPASVTRSPDLFLDLLVRERVTVVDQTPSAFRRLDRADASAEARAELALRLVILGGEALDVGDLRAWWDRRGDERPELVHMYGSTETTVHASYRPLRRADLARSRACVIGQPLPDVTIDLLDPARRLVPVGETGEIWIGGAGVARGYFGRPELTAERFLDDPLRPGGTVFRSGDLGRRLPDGDIEYLGRADQQAEIRDHRVEPGEDAPVPSADRDAASDTPVEQAIADDTVLAFPEGDVVRMFEAAVDRTPDAIALVAGHDELTFRRLDARANRLARHLQGYGVGPGSVVGLCIDRGADAVVAILGILKTGGAHLPLDPAYPKPRIAQLLAEAASTVVVTRDALAELVPREGTRRIRVDGDAFAIDMESGARLDVAVGPRSPCYVLTTAGSTGTPSGVAVEHRTLAGHVRAIATRIGLAAGASHAHVSPLSADLGNTALFPPLCLGGTLHVIPDELTRDPDGLAAHFERHPVDVLALAPTHLAALLSGARPEKILPRAVVILGGEEPARDLCDRIERLAPEARIYRARGLPDGTIALLGRADPQMEIPAVAIARDDTPEEAAEQGPVTGPVPLTPVQRWWLDQDVADPQHHNQAIFLEVHEVFERGALDRAVAHLLAHHDMLRVRVTREGDSEVQEIVPVDEGAAPVDHLGVGHLGGAERTAAIERLAAAAQASLDLAHGPVVRVVHFDLGPSAPGRLLFVVHHMAVDGASWRVLLEDLWSAYEQADRGAPIHLPPKTTSFKRWAERLAEHARSEAVRAEEAHWLAAGKAEVGRIPRDLDGDNLEGSARAAVVELSADETRAVLSRARVEALLLTAFAQTFGAWTGSRRVLVDLEAHGRDEEVANADLTRTVGWFTAIYPAVLELPPNAGPPEAIMAIEEQLRAIPGRGLGYGLLRYLREGESIAERLAALPRAEVSFDYLGQLEQALPESAPFAFARESLGPGYSPRAARPYLLDVQAGVRDDRLRVRFAYSEGLHRKETIEALAARFVEALRALVAHGLSPEAGGHTPSDFRKADLTHEEIGAILDRLVDE